MIIIIKFLVTMSCLLVLITKYLHIPAEVARYYELSPLTIFLAKVALSGIIAGLIFFIMWVCRLIG